MAESAKLHADLVVLGGGPGGYPAAFEAADHGKEVILINEDVQPGGVCANRGCIPSKALLHAAKLLNETSESAEIGLTFSKPKIDLDKLRSWKDGVITQLTGGISQLCKARGVQLIQGRGVFVDSQTIEVTLPDGGKQKVSYEHCILATGSTPAIPPMFQIDDQRIMDSTGALELRDIPKELLVVGGGYIGLEMGSVYAALGSKVTVVEMTNGLLPGADRDLVRPLQKRLQESFEAIHLNTKVNSLQPKKNGIEAELEGEDVEPKQTFDRVLISVGRRPNSRNLGLENTQVKVTERGFVEVDAQRRTADPHILCIGDVAGEPMLAHKATREAKVAIGALLGEPEAFDNVAIPAVVFTDPELAWCGVTESEAKARGMDVKIVRFPWAASGRAQTLARTEGLTKLIVDTKTERILGVGIVGVGAGELIAEGVLAVETATVGRKLTCSIQGTTALYETLMESAEGVFAQATHVFRPKRDR